MCLQNRSFIASKFVFIYTYSTYVHIKISILFVQYIIHTTTVNMLSNYSSKDSVQIKLDIHCNRIAPEAVNLCIHSQIETAHYFEKHRLCIITAIIPERPNLPSLFTHTHIHTHTLLAEPCAHASNYKFPQHQLH